MRLLFLQQWFSQEILKAIGWTLIHSLWQGLLAAVVAGIIIVSTRKSPARLRYNLLGGTIFLFLLVAMVTFFQQLKSNNAAKENFNNLSISVTETFTADNSEIVSTPLGNAIDRFINYFNTNADLFVFIWAIFFLFHCIKMVTGLGGIQRMRTYKVHTSPDEWLEKLSQLSRALGIKQSVGLLQSELVKIPVVIGFFKPVILVPLGLLSHLPPEQVETILLHELAHIRRKDYVVNILQRFAEAVFFFNPAILWISSLIRQEREACCDDIVVANTTNKGSYLEALVSFQEYSFNTPGYVMAISSKRYYLLNRVKRMITRENKKLDIMEKLSLIIGLVVFTAFTFIPQKETISKNNFRVTEPAKELPAQKVTPVISTPVISSSSSPQNAIVKKENKKTVPVVTVDILPTDTVPTKEKEKVVNEEKRFSNISSTINDDGKIKTETTTVTDKDGKMYNYTKLNNKVTSFSIDGKTIPENEIGNYSEFFDQVERAREENKAIRLKKMEMKRADRVNRTVDLKSKLIAQNQLRGDQNRQRRELSDQKRKASEDERSLKMKYQKLLKQKKYVPMINGREVIKNDIHIENSTNANTNIQVALNAETTNLVKTKNITLNNNVELKKGVQLNVDTKTTLLENLEYNISNKQKIKLLDQYEYKTDNVKPAVPEKIKLTPAKPSSETPVKPKSIPSQRKVIT